MSIELPRSVEELSRTSAREVNAIRKLLIDSWEFEPQFFTKFFPVTRHTRRTYRDTEKDLRWGTRWKGMPETEPKSASKLYIPLKNLLNNILLSFQLGEDARRFLNTSRGRIYSRTRYATCPPLFLAGTGSHFINTHVARPLPDYAFGIAVAEVRLESEDELVSRDRLASVMQQMFAHQFNRRFAFGMVISQRTLTLYMFDRSGGLSSPPLDYHSEPEQFCAIVSGLASMDEARIGFDASVWMDTKCRVRTRKHLGPRKTQDATYTIYTTLYYSPQFLTRGTVCFLVYEENDPKTLYVLKDSWEPVGQLDEGRESEGSLLLHAQRQGVKGIVQIVHSEEVHVGAASRTRVDSVLGNRHFSPHTDCPLERIHTRIVMTPYGKPLQHFSNRRELLIAYRDAIQAHRALHDLAGIIHRDIKPANILIYPGGEEGNQGVLIDFDHAIRTDNKSAYSAKRKIGTHFFMSRNALKGETPQTCIDDLESFYFVLLFIVLSFSGPESPHDSLSDLLDGFKMPTAHLTKDGFFMDELNEEVDPYFGRPFETLVKHLHAIFYNHRLKHLRANFHGLPLPILDPAVVYDAFLTNVIQAITELELDDSSSSMGSRSSSSPSDSTENIQISRKRTTAMTARSGDEQHPQVYSFLKLSPPGGKVPVNIQVTAAASRPRRSGAMYGITKRA